MDTVHVPLLMSVGFALFINSDTFGRDLLHPFKGDGFVVNVSSDTKFCL